MKKSEPTPRQFLRSKLGEQPREDVLVSLQEDRYIVSPDDWDADDGGATSAEVLARYRQQARIYAPPQGRREAPVKAPPPDARDYLLSRLVALEAAKLPRVRAFRRRHLPDGLLRSEAIPVWVATRAQAEGEPTCWIKYPLPDAYAVKSDWDAMPPDGMPPQRVDPTRAGTPPLTIGLLPASAEAGKAYLAYPCPDARATQGTNGEIEQVPITISKTVPVKDCGVLDELRLLSEHLALRYHWQPAAATDFVLTGKPPLIESVAVSLKSGRFPEYHRTHITLVIDASTSPEKVLAAYRQVRTQVAKGKRARPLGEKNAHLVAFVLDHPGGQWQGRMEAWNDAYSQWAYTEPTQVKRDYHRARAQVLAGWGL